MFLLGVVLGLTVFPAVSFGLLVAAIWVSGAIAVEIGREQR